MNIKICENNEEMSNYIKYQVQGRKEVSVILSSETLRDIIDEVKAYGITLRISSIITDSDAEEYIVSKFLNKLEKECLVIEPLYQYNIETTDYEPIYVKNEHVIIEEFVLEQDEIEDIVKSDKYELLGLAEDHPELIELDEKECRDCCEGCVGCCNYDTENIKDDESMELLLNEYTDKILETQGCSVCSGCIREILEELYHQGYKEGLTDELLLQNEITQDRLFGEDGLLN